MFNSVCMCVHLCMSKKEQNGFGVGKTEETSKENEENENQKAVEAEVKAREVMFSVGE